MAAKQLRLTVLTPDGPLLDVPDAAWVQAHLADGDSLGIYPGHAPLLAETQAAALRYAAGGQERQTAILEAGIFRVTAGQVLLLTGGPAGKVARVDPGAAAAGAVTATQSFDRLASALLATLQAGAPADEDFP